MTKRRPLLHAILKAGTLGRGEGGTRREGMGRGLFVITVIHSVIPSDQEYRDISLTGENGVQFRQFMRENWAVITREYTHGALLYRC